MRGGAPPRRPTRPDRRRRLLIVAAGLLVLLVGLWLLRDSGPGPQQLGAVSVPPVDAAPAAELPDAAPAGPESTSEEPAPPAEPANTSLEELAADPCGVPRDVPVPPATLPLQALAPWSHPPEDMVAVPGGPVVLGTPAEEVAAIGQNDRVTMSWVAAETPRRTERVEAFCINRTEVTNRQWRAYLRATGRSPSQALVDYSWYDGEIASGEEDRPVTNVNIPEIRAYLAWCGRRLPTEAEWIRAARGDTDQDYPWGESFDGDRCQTGTSVPQRTVKVGSFPDGASPFGVLDMTGNVFEWTESPFRAFPGFQPIPFTIGRKPIQLAPEFNPAWIVVKGGSFISTRELSRIDFRAGVNPSSSDTSLGFRTARDPRPGVQALRNRFTAHRPSEVLRPLGLDEQASFGLERHRYMDGNGGLLGYDHLIFAARRRPAGPAWQTSDGCARVWLGVLSTSVALRAPRVGPGLYGVHFALPTEAESADAAGRLLGVLRLYRLSAKIGDPSTHLSEALISRADRDDLLATGWAWATPGSAPFATRLNAAGDGHDLRLSLSLGAAVTLPDGRVAAITFELSARDEAVADWQ